MSEKKNGIDKALIRDLANILNETDLTEIEVEQAHVRRRLASVWCASLSAGRSFEKCREGCQPRSVSPAFKGFLIYHRYLPR